MRCRNRALHRGCANCGMAGREATLPATVQYGDETLPHDSCSSSVSAQRFSARYLSMAGRVLLGSIVGASRTSGLQLRSITTLLKFHFTALLYMKRVV